MVCRIATTQDTSATDKYTKRTKGQWQPILRTLLGKKVLRDYGSASDYQNGAGQMTGGPYRWENSGISGTGNGEGNLLPMFPLEGYNTLVFVATGGNWVTPDEHPGSGPDAKHNTYYPDWEVPAWCY